MKHNKKAIKHILKFKKHYCRKDEKGNYPCDECEFNHINGKCGVNAFLVSNGEVRKVEEW